MKKLHYSILFMAFICVFLCGYYFSQRIAGRSTSDISGRQVLYYVDPMNPAHTSDKPGLAPCGMKLEPVYADGESSGQVSASPGVSALPGTVKITSEKQQIIGVQVGKVEMVSESHTLRALGRVAADENSIYRVLAPTKGYMGDISSAVPTGSLVKKDQLMASYYGTEALAAQQGYLVVLAALDRRPDDKSSEDQVGSIRSQVRQAEENLKLSGFGEAQIRDISRTRQVSKYVEQRAPIAGLIVSRNIFPNSLFERDTELFRIVDLSRVWVLADVFENEEKYIKPGTAARVSLPGRDSAFHAIVSNAVPQFDSNSRTYKVRLDVANPEWLLRPNEFVDVEFSLKLPSTLTVPREAVLDSGVKKIVFVDHGKGYFEPRKVKTGWSFGDRVEIVGGLMADERIVVSGNFLIDSESRMKMAASSMQGSIAMDPVCGMEVPEKSSKAAGNTSEIDGTTYYFCSPECKREFDTNSNRFVENKAEKLPHGEHLAVPDSSMKPSAHMAHQHSGRDAPIDLEKLHDREAENAMRADKAHEDLAPDSARIQGVHESMALNSQQGDKSHEQPAQNSLQVDPVCGEKVDPRKAEAEGNTSVLDGTTYYFSSDLCKLVFERHPRHFVKKLKEEKTLESETGPSVSPVESHEDEANSGDREGPFQVDPVCGEEVDSRKAQAAGNTSVHDGTTYYFCSESCKTEFDRHAGNIERMEDMAPLQGHKGSPAPSVESHASEALEPGARGALH
jgi:membrane fusion protein, copper/silver efflux system